MAFHKVVAPLFEIQKELQERMMIVKLTHMAIDFIQEWGTKYLTALAELYKRKGRG